MNCEPQQPYYCTDMNEINVRLSPDSPYFDVTDIQLTLFVTSKFHLSATSCATLMRVSLSRYRLPWVYFVIACLFLQLSHCFRCRR